MRTQRRRIELLLDDRSARLVTGADFQACFARLFDIRIEYRLMSASQNFPTCYDTRIAVARSFESWILYELRGSRSVEHGQKQECGDPGKAQRRSYGRQVQYRLRKPLNLDR